MKRDRNADKPSGFQDILNTLTVDEQQSEDMDMEFLAYLLEMSMYGAQEDNLQQMPTQPKASEKAKILRDKPGKPMP